MSGRLFSWVSGALLVSALHNGQTGFAIFWTVMTLYWVLLSGWVDED